MSLTIRSQSDDLLSRSRAAGYEPAALDAVVLIVGMGALGQNVALNLALSGIRELRVVDADRFEPHNRTRSPLFPTEHAGGADGMPKAPSTAAALRRHATHPDAVVRFADAWIEDLGSGAFDDVTVVVSCVDVMRARAHLADRCRLLGVPLVEGGFGGAEVTYAVFPAAVDADEAARLACWRCGKKVHDDTVSCRARAVYAERAGIVPAIQTAAATLGGLQAEAVIEVLHGHCAEPRRIWLDVRTGAGMSARLTADPGCTGAHRLLPAPLLVDVRSGASLGEILDAARPHVGCEPALELPWPYVTQGVCPSCDRVIDVGAPGHRYLRAPFCTDCRGPWPLEARGEYELNPVSLVRRGDALAGVTGAAAGLAAGDLVVVSTPGQERLLRLAGGPGDLFAAV